MRFITGAIVLMTAATSIATDTDLLNQEYGDKIISELESALALSPGARE